MLQLFTSSVNQKLVNICYLSPPLGRKGGGWVSGKMLDRIYIHTYKQHASASHKFQRLTKEVNNLFCIISHVDNIMNKLNIF